MGERKVRRDNPCGIIVILGIILIIEGVGLLIWALRARA